MLGFATIIKELKLHQDGSIKVPSEDLFFGRVPCVINYAIMFKDCTAFLDRDVLAIYTTEREGPYLN